MIARSLAADCEVLQQKQTRRIQQSPADSKVERGNGCTCSQICRMAMSSLGLLGIETNVEAAVTPVMTSIIG